MLRKLLVIVTFVFANYANAQSKYDIRYKPNTRDTIALSIGTQVTTKVSYSTGSVAMSADINMGYSTICESVDDSGYVLRMIYSRIASIVNTHVLQGGKSSKSAMELDTEKEMDEDEQDNELVFKLYTVYKMLCGQSYTIKYDKQGRVVDLNGLKEIKKQMMKYIREKWSSSSQYETLRTSVSQMLDEEQTQFNLENSVKFYPNREVAIGETWTAQIRSKANNTDLLCQGQYKLVSVDKDSIGRVEIKMPCSGSNQTQNLTMKMKQSGYALLDLRSGILTYYSINGTIKGKSQQNGQKFKITGTSAALQTRKIKSSRK